MYTAPGWKDLLILLLPFVVAMLAGVVLHYLRRPKQARTYTIKGDGYRIVVTTQSDGSGHITSDIKGDDFDEAETHLAAEIDALESLVLAHACAGIDVCDPRYVDGLDTAFNKVYA